MKTLITALLILSLTSEKFNPIGKWQGEDDHHHKIEITLMENLNASILYPETPKNNIRNQTVTYKIENTKNDSLFYLDFEKSIKNMDGSVQNETTFCSIKFLDANTINLSYHADKKARLENKGNKMSLSRN